MFIIPMPPTSRLTEATAPSMNPIDLDADSALSKNSVRFLTVKSSSSRGVSLWRFLNSTFMSSSASASLPFFALIIMELM